MSTADPSRPGGQAPRQPTGKQRASRIPLDYWKQRSPLDASRLWLTGLVVLLTLGGLAYGLFLLPNRGANAVSRGPVTSVHAFIDQQCFRCHVDFQPIGQQGAGGGDARCQACHAGPTHHASQLDSATPGCGACHRDHRGRDASLVRLVDADCTSCHRDLKAHMKPDATARGKNAVTSFDKEHFQVPDKDPGTIKFNHQLHLTKGLKAKWTLNQIADEKERDRYRNQQPDDKDKDDASEVQLACASCHRLDAGDFGRGKHSGAPSPGAYFQPITYDNQCKACHVLTFDKDVAEPAPHRLQPKQVRELVEGVYARKFFLDKDAKVDRQLPTATTLPGKKPSDPEELKSAQKHSRDKAREALTYLFGPEKRDKGELAKQTCSECHSYEDFKGKDWPEKVEPAGIPEVWQRKARFNHVSHRAMNCLDCHGPRGDKPGAEESTRHTDVLLPGADNCLQCHTPARTENGQQVAGVRHDCTACHTFHHGADPLQGLGAAARDPHEKLDVKKFLRGEK